MLARTTRFVRVISTAPSCLRCISSSFGEPGSNSLDLGVRADSARSITGALPVLAHARGGLSGSPPVHLNGECGSCPNLRCCIASMLCVSSSFFPRLSSPAAPAPLFHCRRAGSIALLLARSGLARGARLSLVTGVVAAGTRGVHSAEA